MKILKIASCGNCPYLSVEGIEDIYYCERMAGRDIRNEAKEIPDWCPLPDAPNNSLNPTATVAG